MIPYKITYRLNEYKTWWFSEFEKHPRDRNRNTFQLNDKLVYHVRNLMKAFGDLPMASKKKSNVFKWQGYVNINIAEHMHDAVQAYAKDEKHVFFTMNQVLVEGYRIAYNYDAENETVKCTLTCYAEDSPNHGYAMSAFAGDWYTALAVALFKHQEISEGDWTEYKSSISKAFG